MYYDLVSWHRVLAMLPGYGVNRRFMEEMMGVREPLPDSVDVGHRPIGRMRESVRIARTLLGLVANHLLLDRSKRAFEVRLEEALGSHSRDELAAMRADELVAHYRDLERRLLSKWDAPLVNDFFAMIFYGVLRRLVRAWCGATEPIENDLLAGNGGVISAEPAARVLAMGREVARYPDLASALGCGSRREALAALSRHPDLERQFSEYLDHFGDRCLEELKLESPTLRDEPLVLLRSIASASTCSFAVRRPDGEPRSTSERRVRSALAWRPIRRLIFGWVLSNARDRVRDRENLRFERTRVFGRARAIFVELGKRLYADQALDHPRDVFYLEVDEVLGWVDGTATCADLRSLASVRRAELNRHRAELAPMDRFETRGAVHADGALGQRARRFETPSTDLGDDCRQGLACSPGVVMGRARVVVDPRGAVVLPGEILVAERTDPGWVVLFASASGLVVERGSVLSHAAIVAREMAIPAVTSIPGLMNWLETGDIVEVDGRTGIVRRVAPSGPESKNGEQP